MAARRRPIKTRWIPGHWASVISIIKPI
ncbi:hypothetical protein YPPY65_2901, partial [Yersinia pestis PY-65]